MKKLVGMFSVALLLFILLPGTSEAQVRFGFKGYGGLNYLMGGDLNKGAQGFGETWVGLWLTGMSPKGEFAPVNLGMNFGGELLLQFSPDMGIGLGAGLISATKSSEITYTPKVANVDFTWDSNVSAIPITATFYYFLPSGGNMKFYISVGAGYYLAKVDFEHRWFYLVPINWDVKTSGGGLGFHGGFGLEFAMSPMFGILFEVKGRYAAFSNFEGSVVWTYPGTGWSSDTEEGSLWAYEYNYGGTIGTQTWLWVSETKPSGTDVRKAKVDFSGFSFIVGFIVRFGS